MHAPARLAAHGGSVTRCPLSRFRAATGISFHWGYISWVPGGDHCRVFCFSDARSGATFIDPAVDDYGKRICALSQKRQDEERRQSGKKERSELAPLFLAAVRTRAQKRCGDFRSGVQRLGQIQCFGTLKS